MSKQNGSRIQLIKYNTDTKNKLNKSGSLNKSSRDSNSKYRQIMYNPVKTIASNADSLEISIENKISSLSSRLNNNPKTQMKINLFGIKNSKSSSNNTPRENSPSSENKKNSIFSAANDFLNSTNRGPQKNKKAKFNNLIKINKHIPYIIKFLKITDISSIMNSGKRMRILIDSAIRMRISKLINTFKTNNSHLQINNSKIIFNSLKSNIFLYSDKSISIDLSFTCMVLENQINKTKCLSLIYKYENDTDFYKNTYRYNLISDQENNNIWIFREYTEFFSDNLKKCIIQPLISVKKYDKTIINMNILGNKGYIDKFKMITSYFHSNKINKPNLLDRDYSTFCELEYVKSSWRDIKYFHGMNIVLNKISSIFNKNFDIKNAYYDDVGYYLFKLVMVAMIPGVIYLNKEIGIEIRIREMNDLTTNEIKKNDLLFDRINFLELRVGDILTFYVSHAK